MHPLRHTAQALLSGIFLVGGFDAVLDPKSKVPGAKKVLPEEVKVLGYSIAPEAVVRANGVLQMMAGTLLAGNSSPRLAAITLTGSLIPTTLAGHRFWEEDAEKDRVSQRLQFMKNAAIIGGLLMIIIEAETSKKSKP